MTRLDSAGTTAVLEQLRSLGVEKTVEKGTVLLHEGMKLDSFFVIHEGLAKAYYTTIDGKEFIKSIIGEGECIASAQVIVQGEPCPFYLITLERTRFIEIPGTRLLELVRKCSEFTQFMNSTLLQIAMKKERREYELLCLSAEQRYRLFCQRNPRLLERLSQIDIARYLGITPVALSRIRKRIRTEASQISGNSA